jgi:superfamily II DNA or RNA helicase
MEHGYIYIRTHYTWDEFDAYKFGKTTNLIEREPVYTTGEIIGGFYVKAFIVNLSILDRLEIKMMEKFKKLGYHVYHGGGHEFFKKKIIDIIEPYLIEKQIPYSVLSQDEIDDINNEIKISQSIDTNNKSDNFSDSSSFNDFIIDDKYEDEEFDSIEKIENKNISDDEYINNFEEESSKISSEEHIIIDSDETIRIINKKLQIKKKILIPDIEIIKYIPRDYQNEIINKSYTYFKKNNKGLLIIPCGVGKTLISLWIAQKLNSKTILIGVPNVLLLHQWYNAIHSIFDDIPLLLVLSGINTIDVIKFLDKNYDKCIIVTTYKSSKKVREATESISFKFNIKINDETHHLTTSDMKRSDNLNTYVQMLHIPSLYQLSLTATLKQLQNDEDDDNVISNENVDYFGEIIERKCLLWAINKKIVCDYVVHAILNDKDEMNQLLTKYKITNDEDARLFLSAYVSLRNINDGNSHHLLIYVNSKKNSLKLIKYLDMLLKKDDEYFKIPEIFFSEYHSNMKKYKLNMILNKFEHCKNGIITCVYCLGEGWDFPLLDGVVFAENMTSDIRIVQSALRASRKNKDEPDKITKLIIPVLNKGEWLDNNDNSDLKKIREIIYQMGLEDETIEHKIKAYVINNKKHKSKIKIIDSSIDIDYYDDELTKKILIRTIHRCALGVTYEKARKIIAGKKIMSKESYFELCDKDKRLSKEPDVIYKFQFKNWIDYLSIERIYYDLNICKIKINEYLSLYPDIKKHCLDLSLICIDLCELDKMFPPCGLWTDYYNVKDLRDILILTNNNSKKKSIIL